MLTSEEQEAICLLRENKVKTREFFINEIFNIKNSHNILSSQIVANSGEYPYVTAGESNNSISTYIDFDINQIEKGKTIMIGGKTLVITYQEKDYFSNDSHNLILSLLDEKNNNESTMLFMVACLYKSLKPKYTWGSSISKAKIQNDSFILPITTSGEIDYDFMQTYIRAIQKLAIKNVVLWKDKQIEATKQVVG